jgi:hypothetical protein
MAKGLAKVREIAGNQVSVVADCGTGTGFVTTQAAEYGFAFFSQRFKF